MGLATLGVAVGIVFHAVVLWPMERDFKRRKREIAESLEARRTASRPASAKAGDAGVESDQCAVKGHRSAEGCGSHSSLRPAHDPRQAV